MIKIYDIWFSNLEISNSLKLKLLQKFENTESIWKLKKKDFEEFEVTNKNVSKILDIKYRLSLDKYAKLMEENKIGLILCNDKRYPLNLSKIDDKPACLYVRGKIENLKFFIAGTGTEEEALKEMVKTYGLQDLCCNLKRRTSS